ncbi:hypothetical protein [Psychroflexus sediminis]|uniref:DUF4382 domain-containing protein n=1 Tax=Psychroflexus sediminis TaxID=470826 RepID=A0A1G7VYB1_9FLAO|nr:hypothetical protein [Psychroflexus sediminis]SDG64661.1 hypothetical protein SAMN04488027_104249 [Psychroflexus sediminis]
MKHLFSKLVALTLLVSIFACSDEDSSNSPKLSVNFNTVVAPFDAVAESKTMTTTSAVATGSFLFSDGFITLSALEYEAETENDSTSVEFELEGAVRIDFATGIPSPDIRSINIPTGTYQAVEVEVELYDETDEPSVVINGTYTAPDAEMHPVRFEFNSGETFEVEREGTVVIAEGQSALAEITFDPSVWFAGVTDEIMLGANKNAEGVIVISETQNTEIFNIVADGLDLATDFEFSN